MSELLAELGTLVLKFPIPIYTIRDVSIITEADQHGKLLVEVVCTKRLDIKDVLAIEDTPIKLSDTKDKVLFCGICEKVTLTNTAQFSRLSIAANGKSILADRTKLSRTFQDSKKKLSDVAKVVLAETKGHAEINPDKAIKNLLCQNDETDYGFLRRVANENNLCVFSDVRNDSLALCIGKSRFENAKLPDNIQFDNVQKDVLKYILIKENSDKEAEPFEYTQKICTIDDLSIMAGDTIQGQRKMYVEKSEIYTDGAILRNRLTIVDSDCCKPVADNCGASDKYSYLFGKVLAVKGNNIQVQFECDKEQDKAKTMMIPYEQVGSNYFYSMPDVGDRVMVYFDYDGKKVSAVNSHRLIKDDDKGKKIRKDFEPTSKLIVTGKKIFRFTPSAVEFSTNRDNLIKGKGEQASIQFDTAKGIRIYSNKDINIKAKTSLRLQASSSPVMFIDVFAQYIAKSKVGETRHIAGAGIPNLDMMDDIQTGLGYNISAAMNGAPKDENGEETAILKYIKANMPGGKAIKFEKPQKEKRVSYDSGHMLNIVGAKKCIFQVGKSTLTLSDGKIEAKASAVRQLGFLPKSSGASGSSLAIKAQDDYDDKKIVNMPVLKKNKKSVGKLKDLKSGAGGSGDKGKEAKGLEDVKREAMNVDIIKKDNRVWELTTKSTGNLIDKSISK